jgi:S1-C subfamily serine protease
MRTLCLFFATILAINGCAYRPHDGLDIGGIGSGFAVSAQGHLLTNHHVIANCQAISAVTPSAHEVEVHLLRSDPARDLALLMMAEAATRPALFVSPKTRLTGARLSGDTVRFLGYPNGGSRSLRPVIRPGRILQFAGGPLSVPVIVFKGKTDPGNSGGPLLTPAGHVIGLVFAKANTPAIYRAAGEEAAKSMTNVGLALPFWEILLFLEQAEISYEIATDTNTAPAAERFMVRVNCWK